MQRQSIVDLVQSQVIPAVKDPALLEKVIHVPSNVVFLLVGNLLTTKGYIRKLQAHGKEVFLHLDLIEGISNDRSVIDFIAKEWKPTGVITTKSHMIKAAKRAGLMSIQRIFIIDHGAMDKGKELAESCNPDAIEILPGIAPRAIDEMTRKVKIPIIAGGLIDHKEEVLIALENGALAASVSNSSLWDIGL